MKTFNRDEAGKFKKITKTDWLQIGKFILWLMICIPFATSWGFIYYEIAPGKKPTIPDVFASEVHENPITIQEDRLKKANEKRERAQAEYSEAVQEINGIAAELEKIKEDSRNDELSLTQTQ